MTSHIIKWILTASIVISEIILAKEDSEVRDQFQNLFDSTVKKNSLQNGEIYRNFLNQNVEQERQIFHEMKNEIYMARNKMFGNMKNIDMVYKNITKRQIETEVKNEKTKRTKKEKITTAASDEMGIEKPPKVDPENYMPARPVVELKDLEGAYIRHFANSTKNGTNWWLDVKKIERQNKLAAMCTRAHFLHGGAMYDVIEQATVLDGVLQFVKKENENHSPIRINVVKYKSDVEDRHYYLTKGLKPTCVFYLQPLNNSKSEYCLSEYVQEVPMPTL